MAIAAMNLNKKFNAISIGVIRPLMVICLLMDMCNSHTTAENLSSTQMANFSCVDWHHAPEAAVGNCTRFGGRAGALRCYGGINNLPLIPEQKLRKLEEIILCGWPDRDFDPNDYLQSFPRIRALIIEYSSFTAIDSDFPEMTQLQSINISWTNLSHVNARTFERVYTLKVLDLRWNRLVHLDSLILPRSFEQLYLAGNPWDCTHYLNWLVTEKGQQVVDREDILCTDKLFRERRMLLVMQYKVTVKEDCEKHDVIRNCTCSLNHILPSLKPIYTVNCSNLNFQRLPDYVPMNTTTLYISNNSISDVIPLLNNPIYREVWDLFLDDNLIVSIDMLEGGYWLENYRVLSLRGNRLSKIPVYAVENAFQDNPNLVFLYLSRNPWFCTCKFAMRFREFLMKYAAVIKDGTNVSCTYRPNTDKNEFRSISAISITRQDVCKPKEQASVYFLDILNGVLALLIVITLSKLAYDYYHYKYYGRVPWIVMKMP